MQQNYFSHNSDIYLLQEGLTMKISCSASYLQLSEKRIILMGKGKGHEGTEGEYKCSSTLPLTSALHGVSG